MQEPKECSTFCSRAGEGGMTGESDLERDLDQLFGPSASAQAADAAYAADAVGTRKLRREVLH